MMQVALLLSWMVIGIAVAAVRRAPDEPRLAWAPIAAVLGPLWLVVASERTRLDELRRHLEARAWTVDNIAVAAPQLAELLALADRLGTEAVIEVRGLQAAAAVARLVDAKLPENRLRAADQPAEKTLALRIVGAAGK